MTEENDFKLVSTYQPAGDQPAAIQGLVESFEEGKRKLCLVGVTGSGKTYTMASFIQEVGRPTLVLTHNKTLAAQLYREFREFFPENAVEYFVSYYDYYQPEAYVPTSDTYIEKDASINDEIDRLRLRATSSLLERRDVIIVSSVSCIYGLGSPEEYRHSLIMLDRGVELDRNTVMRQLLHIQYSRNDLDFSRGNFRVRGDTLEIFPAYRQEGVRVEWFGDEIEKISVFDPLTGKVIAPKDRVVIYPAKHFITSPPRLEEAVKLIEAELIERVKTFNEQGKPLEAERIEQRTRYDLEMLRQMGYCNGIENYSRHLTGRKAGEAPACLLDYFPEDFVVMVDESHQTMPQVRGMYEGDRARKQNLVDFGFRLPSALDNRPLNFTEFEAMVDSVVYVSATPADYELERADARVEQIIRPTGLLDPQVEVRPVANQIENLLGEIRERMGLDERVLVTTLTKKMAEDLSDYLSDMDVNVAYLHSEIQTIERVEIIRDLRKGQYDVLVGVNLLREGLDMPEVSLVAILDADKEGFLRNARSLIQTMGRAARNVNGHAILYADKVTDSMQFAIDETKRRRAIQEAYNTEHNIQPTSIRKAIHDIIEREFDEIDEEERLLAELEREVKFKKGASRKEKIDTVRKAMLDAARNLEFEKAALLRDRLGEIEQGAEAVFSKNAPEEETKKDGGKRGKKAPFRPRSGTRGQSNNRRRGAGGGNGGGNRGGNLQDASMLEPGVTTITQAAATGGRNRNRPAGQRGQSGGNRQRSSGGNRDQSSGGNRQRSSGGQRQEAGGGNGRNGAGGNRRPTGGGGNRQQSGGGAPGGNRAGGNSRNAGNRQSQGGGNQKRSGGNPGGRSASGSGARAKSRGGARRGGRSKSDG
jgi:excinuclease ABC subunit B